MPTYEYACKGCGQHLEVVQSFKDAALTECPACGGTLRKVFQPIGIAFKGSGFYKTDSRDSGSKARSEKPSEGSKTSDKAASPPSDGKAASSGESSSAASSGKSSSAAAS